MDTNQHVDVDVLAAFALGGLDGAARRLVEEHLATGCARCRAERAWVERTIALARCDDSLAPPPHILARAVRIFAVERAGMPVPQTLWRRLRALPLFDSQQRSSAALAAGARGTGGTTRQVLFGVAELDMEIDVQTQRHAAMAERIELRGQVFPADDDTGRVAGLRVAVQGAAGETQQAVTSALGAFSLQVPEGADLLVLHLGGCAIEVPIPQPPGL